MLALHLAADDLDVAQQFWHDVGVVSLFYIIAREVGAHARVLHVTLLLGRAFHTCTLRVRVPRFITQTSGCVFVADATQNAGVKARPLVSFAHTVTRAA